MFKITGIKEFNKNLEKYKKQVNKINKETEEKYNKLTREDIGLDSDCSEEVFKRKLLKLMEKEAQTKIDRIKF